MCAAVPAYRSLVFICGKRMFHKLKEKAEHQDRQQIRLCLPLSSCE